MKTATRTIQNPDNVVLDDNGLKVTAKHAAALGYTISDAPAVAAPAPSYRDKLNALPEAQGRASSVAKIADAYSEKSMPIDRAQRMLRSLPLDPPKVAPARSVPTSISAARATRFRRNVELRMSGLAHRADCGDPAARSEAKSLAYALRVTDMTGASLVAALESVRIDPKQFTKGL